MDKPVVVFPAVRFFPDKDEQGHFLVDKEGKWKSGTLEVVLFEQGKDGSARTLGTHSEKMSFTKYRATREDIDTMSVDELKQYFPGLVPETATEETEPVVDPRDAEIAKLKAQLEAANAKESTPKSTKAPGQANGKSGSEETKQESPKPDQTTPETTQE